MARGTKVIRISEESHARLLRLAERTGATHPEIVTRALDLYEGRVGSVEPTRWYSGVDADFWE